MSTLQAQAGTSIFLDKLERQSSLLKKEAQRAFALTVFFPYFPLNEITQFILQLRGSHEVNTAKASWMTIKYMYKDSSNKLTVSNALF